MNPQIPAVSEYRLVNTAVQVQRSGVPELTILDLRQYLLTCAASSIKRSQKFLDDILVRIDTLPIQLQ